jgi:hypothetical protein
MARDGGRPSCLSWRVCGCYLVRRAPSRPLSFACTRYLSRPDTMGRHRNSSYACYTVLFANGQLIAINIDSQRLPSTPFRRFGSARPVDAVLRQIHRQTLASGASFSTSFGHRQQAGVGQIRSPRGVARLSCAQIGVPSSRTTRDQSFQMASGGRHAQKERRRGAIKVQSFEIKTVLWKNKSVREYCR